MDFKNEKVVGLWMDKLHGYLIGTTNGLNEGTYEILKSVKSEHHSDHGSSEYAHHNKESQELKGFFKNLSHDLTGYSCIYIFGPGKVQEQFINYLNEQHAFKSILLEHGASDHITHDQMIAMVRNHFK